MIIFAGDFSRNSTLQNTVEFCEWFESLDYKYKVLVPGNHDYFLNLWLGNTTILVHNYKEIAGLKIFGSAWTPIFMDWNYMTSETVLENSYELIPENLDILITHGPPK